MSKEITVTVRWESTHVIEVPDDFTMPATLGGFPQEALEEFTSETASIVDWW